MNKYAVYKLWFCYTDEWYATSNELATCNGIYDTYEAALTAKAAADRKSLIDMESQDWLRDLMGFEKNSYGFDFQNRLIEYYRSQNWDACIEAQDPNGMYYYVHPPKTPSPDQLDAILTIANASFHRIVEYKDLKEAVYIKLNYDFWGRKVFEKLKIDGVLESRSTPEKGFYLVNKPPKGRKSAKFTDWHSARDFALQQTLASIIAFDENHFLGRTYLEDTTAHVPMLLAYITACQSIGLQTEAITDKNLKTVQGKLKKWKSGLQKNVGDVYYTLQLPNQEPFDKNELNGLFELMKLKPFSVYRMVTEVNGEAVKAYVSGSSPI